MFLFGIVMLAIGAPFDVAHGRPVDSALWSCRRGSASVFTNRPTSTADSPCVVAPLDGAPYSRVPAEYFEQEIKRLEAREVSRREEFNRATSAVSDSSYGTTWKSEEVPPVPGSLTASCQVRGKAHGAEAGKAIVSIRRGGATVDEVPISLKKSGETPWEVSLAGKCLSSEVTVRKLE